MFGATVRLGGGVNLNQLSNMHAKHRRSTLKGAPLFTPPTTSAAGRGGATKLRKSAACSSFLSKNEPDLALVDESTQETLAAESSAMDLDAEQERPLQRPKALIKTSSKLKIKKSLDRKTFLAVCRAVVFGVTLIGLGVVMAVLGFYRDYFAQEPGPMVFDLAKNATVVSTVVNRSTKAQVESLSYIGPCIMGCGMFILMMACVMTLEGRDRNTHLFTQRIINRRRQIMRQNQEMEQKERTQSKIHLMDIERIDRVTSKKKEGPAGPNSEGNFNRAFKDDHTLKSAAPVANNAVQSAADVQLTLSRNGGVDSHSIKNAADAIHTPATGQLSSASTGAVVADRQLLHRFLDEQSQMDDYMRILKQSRIADAPHDWSPNDRRGTTPPGGTGVVVSAQIHDYHERPLPLVKRAPLAAPETVSTICSGVTGSAVQSNFDVGDAAGRNTSEPSPFCLFSPPVRNSDIRRNSSQNSATSFVTVRSQISSSANNNYHKNQFSNSNPAKTQNSTVLTGPESSNVLTMQP